jgi:hypothetical protein
MVTPYENERVMRSGLSCEEWRRRTGWKRVRDVSSPPLLAERRLGIEAHSSPPAVPRQSRFKNAGRGLLDLARAKKRPKPLVLQEPKV